jgi:polysaccharide biosynthesis/export protein
MSGHDQLFTNQYDTLVLGVALVLLLHSGASEVCIPDGRRNKTLKILRSMRLGVLALAVFGVANTFAPAAAGQTAQDKDATKGAPPQAQSKPSSASKPSEQAPDSDSYRIGIGDELQISVWREPELSMPVQVRPDGMITLPLINDLPVVGLNTHQLQNVLSEKLKPFVNEPQVTVIVRNIHSRKVYLMGQVGKPGPYVLNERKTVLELITEAGGPGPFAKTGSIYIIRNINGQQTRLKFNYKKALAAKPDAGDIELMPGDMVVVP